MDRISLLPASSAPLAPAWEVERWFGTPSPLEDLRGKVVVLHAFQMLCPGCVLHGVPQAARIHDTFDEVAVVGLHTVFEHHDAMQPPSLAAFLHEFRVPFPVAVDVHAPGVDIPKTMARYQLRGTPSLVLIDARGRLRANVFGRPDDLVVGAAIGTLVAEAEADTAPRPDPGAPASACTDAGCSLPVQPE